MAPVSTSCPLSFRISLGLPMPRSLGLLRCAADATHPVPWLTPWSAPSPTPSVAGVLHTLPIVPAQFTWSPFTGANSAAFASESSRVLPIFTALAQRTMSYFPLLQYLARSSLLSPLTLTLESLILNPKNHSNQRYAQLALLFSSTFCACSWFYSQPRRFAISQRNHCTCETRLSPPPQPDHTFLPLRAYFLFLDATFSSHLQRVPKYDSPSIQLAYCEASKHLCSSRLIHECPW